MNILAKEVICERNGNEVILQHLGHEPLVQYSVNWCVQYAGAGHYFKTLDGAERYLEKRGFVRGKPTIFKDLQR